MGAGFENNHLERGPHSAFQEMTAVRGAVGFANDHVGVQHWFALLFHDVAGKGQDFYLLFYRNFSIAFLLSIEETESDFTERANGRDLCSSEPIFRRKPHQRLLRFLI